MLSRAPVNLVKHVRLIHTVRDRYVEKPYLVFEHCFWEGFEAG